MSESQHNWWRYSMPILGCALAAISCVDDALDGKASKVTVVEPSLDASTPQAMMTGDASFDEESLTLTLNCPRAVLSDSVTKGFVIKVLDEEGNPPPPPGMWASVVPSTGTVRTGQAGGGTTDRYGELDFEYVAPHTAEDTKIGIAVDLKGAGEVTVATEECTVEVAAKALRFTEPVTGSTLPFDHAVPLGVEVAIDGLAAKCAAGGGVRLSYDAKSGGVALKESGPFKSELCVNIDDDGNLPMLWLGGGTAGGTTKLIATAGDYESELLLTQVGAPALLYLQTNDTDIGTASASAINVQVIDDSDHPVQGVTVQLEVERCADTTCTSQEMVSPKEVVTDSDGKATTAYFSGTKRGAAQIAASIKGHPKVVGTLIVRVN